MNIRLINKLKDQNTYKRGRNIQIRLLHLKILHFFRIIILPNNYKRISQITEMKTDSSHLVSGSSLLKQKVDIRKFKEFQQPIKRQQKLKKSDNKENGFRVFQRVINLLYRDKIKLCDIKNWQQQINFEISAIDLYAVLTNVLLKTCSAHMVIIRQQISVIELSDENSFFKIDAESKPVSYKEKRFMFLKSFLDYLQSPGQQKLVSNQLQQKLMQESQLQMTQYYTEYCTWIVYHHFSSLIPINKQVCKIIGKMKDNNEQIKLTQLKSEIINKPRQLKNTHNSLKTSMLQSQLYTIIQQIAEFQLIKEEVLNTIVLENIIPSDCFISEIEKSEQVKNSKKKIERKIDISIIQKIEGKMLKILNQNKQNFDQYKHNYEIFKQCLSNLKKKLSGQVHYQHLSIGGKEPEKQKLNSKAIEEFINLERSQKILGNPLFGLELQSPLQQNSNNSKQDQEQIDGDDINFYSKNMFFDDFQLQMDQSGDYQYSFGRNPFTLDEPEVELKIKQRQKSGRQDCKSSIKTKLQVEWLNKHMYNIEKSKKYKSGNHNIEYMTKIKHKRILKQNGKSCELKISTYEAKISERTKRQSDIQKSSSSESQTEVRKKRTIIIERKKNNSYEYQLKDQIEEETGKETQTELQHDLEKSIAEAKFFDEQLISKKYLYSNRVKENHVGTQEKKEDKNQNVNDNQNESETKEKRNKKKKNKNKNKNKKKNKAKTLEIDNQQLSSDRHSTKNQQQEKLSPINIRTVLSQKQLEAVKYFEDFKIKQQRTQCFLISEQNMRQIQERQKICQQIRRQLNEKIVDQKKKRAKGK